MSSVNPILDKNSQTPADKNEAADLIRSKLSQIYASEPNASQEAREAESVKKRSKHQEFMHKLTTSGNSLAQIQTDWHNYYTQLPDSEKHEVWQEFYRNQSALSNFARTTDSRQGLTEPEHTKPRHAPRPKQSRETDNRSVSDIKKQLLDKVGSRVPVKHKRHLKSLGFGLGMGIIVLAFMMFGFFNERFIAPLITPSRNVSSTPIISDSNAAVGKDPKIIIPKINVEIPVVYDEPSVDEKAVQNALEGGVLHYATTPKPGEQGNAVIFGHSSNNILNKGKYKFAFVLLSRMEAGDTFMIEKDGQRYIYKVFEKKIVQPDNLSVLDNRDRPTVSLITCDPPGTSINRLVVVGEQISPDPSTNVASSVKTADASPEILPSNAPTLWSRFWTWISS